MKVITKYKWLILVALVAGVAGIQVVMADDDEPKGGRGGKKDFIKTFDANNDGAVTMEEMKSVREAKWKEKHPNEKPKADMVKKADEKLREHFAKMDENHDGKIVKDELPNGKTVTRADFLKRAGEGFDRLDLNKDGKLTPEEREQAKEKNAQERGSKGEGKRGERAPKKRGEGKG